MNEQQSAPAQDTDAGQKRTTGRPTTFLRGWLIDDDRMSDPEAEPIEQSEDLASQAEDGRGGSEPRTSCT